MKIKRKINGRTWTLRILSKKEMDREAENDAECVGLCAASEKTIFIREDSVNYNTIAHELFHAFASDLCLADTEDIGLKNLEEIFAVLFETKGILMIKKAKQFTNELKQLLKEGEE